jgi:hypothetical protein
MTIERIRSLYQARPFQPFTIHLADGRRIPVVSHEFMMIGAAGRTIVVQQPDETLNIIDLLLVTDVEIRPNGRTSPRRRRSP